MIHATETRKSFLRHEGTLFLFQFGAYGTEYIVTRANHFEAGFEQAVDKLAEISPGQFSQWEDFDDDSIEDGEPVDHMYTEHGYLASWEIHGSEIDKKGLIDLYSRIRR